MTEIVYPSIYPAWRRADMIAHGASALFLALIAPPLLGGAAGLALIPRLSAWAYILTAAFSVAVSAAYHFAPVSDRRAIRRWDHAAIYPLIVGAISPALAQAGTPFTLTALAALWTIAVLGMVYKLRSAEVGSHLSTIAYLLLGGGGLAALLVAKAIPSEAVPSALVGVGFYVLGAAAYSRKALPYRYAIWHGLGLCGGVAIYLTNSKVLFG